MGIVRWFEQMPVTILETSRLRLQELEPGDAGLILRVLNTEGFLRHVGDRGLRSEADALDYLAKGPIASYREHGYGLWKLVSRMDGRKVGIGGLLRRDHLPCPDLGYALLPEFEGQGLASETGAAVLRHATGVLGLDRILAIVAPDNVASIRVLEKIGMHASGELEINATPLRLFAFPQ